MTQHCYVTTGDYPEETEIEFAESVTDLECRTATRKPEWDQFAAQGYVPLQVLLEAGWWHECHVCNRRVGIDGCDDDGEDEDGNPLPSGPPIIEQHRVFCSASCKERHENELTEIRRLRAEGEKKIKSRFPWVRAMRWFTGSCGGDTCFSKHHNNQTAQIEFDGSRVGNNHYCHGCGRIWICTGDMEAWENLRKQEAADSSPVVGKQ